jgi:hypothetical protein
MLSSLQSRFLETLGQSISKLHKDTKYIRSGMNIANHRIIFGKLMASVHFLLGQQPYNSKDVALSVYLQYAWILFLRLMPKVIYSQDVVFLDPIPVNVPLNPEAEIVDDFFGANWMHRRYSENSFQNSPFPGIFIGAIQTCLKSSKLSGDNSRESVLELLDSKNYVYVDSVFERVQSIWLRKEELRESLLQTQALYSDLCKKLVAYHSQMKLEAKELPKLSILIPTASIKKSLVNLNQDRMNLEDVKISNTALIDNVVSGLNSRRLMKSLQLESCTLNTIFKINVRVSRLILIDVSIRFLFAITDEMASGITELELISCSDDGDTQQISRDFPALRSLTVNDCGIDTAKYIQNKRGSLESVCIVRTDTNFSHLCGRSLKSLHLLELTPDQMFKALHNEQTVERLSKTLIELVLWWDINYYPVHNQLHLNCYPYLTRLVLKNVPSDAISTRNPFANLRELVIYIRDSNVVTNLFEKFKTKECRFNLIVEDSIRKFDGLDVLERMNVTVYHQ